MSTKIVFFAILLSIATTTAANHDYKDALSKSIIFFEGQRSGKLPPHQSITWRSDSGLSDGSSDNVDLTGGYYDAGDNVKFGFPMAFTTTMMAWSVLEFGRRMADEQLEAAREAVRWGSDYLLKASAHLPNALYVQVGDPKVDHKCWERAEDMTTARPVYKVTPSNPGSDVAAETAAALAAASRVFRHVDPGYSSKLIEAAEKAFAFADTYRGSYSDSLSSVVCPFYCSYSGYHDELLWGAAWLFKATHNASYLDYAKSLGLDDDSDVFSWDNKLPGTRVLLSRDSHIDDEGELSTFKEHAQRFMCNVLRGSPSQSVSYTPGGLMYKMDGSNLQYVTSSTFLMTTYAKYLKAAEETFNCGDFVVSPSQLREQAKKQVDYILGDNPNEMSYMVGYSDRYPHRIHHRDSSIPIYSTNGMSSSSYGCDGGFQFLYSDGPNPNVLTGAVVGGPDKDDSFSDARDNYGQSEPATYINAPLIGSLAYLAASFEAASFESH